MYEKDFYTMEEVAQLLKVSHDTVQDWVRRGLPFTRTAGKLVVLRENLVEWLDDIDH